MSKLPVPAILESGARTYRERNAIYGDSWETFTAIMALLFPNGLDLRKKDNIFIYNILSHIVGKVVRFTNSEFTSDDSIHDVSVYAAMIEAYLHVYRRKKGARTRGRKRSQKASARLQRGSR